MRWRWLASVALAAALLAPAAAQETRVHGENSIFATAGVKLGWVVKRGANETETLVIVRVVASDAGYRLVSFDGVDPVTRDRKGFVAARALDPITHLSLPWH